jgi:anti-sigma B factor antagonist
MTGTLVIHLSGEFDVSQRERLQDAFAVANSASTVVVDFTDVEFMDSTVLTCLIELQKATARRGGAVTLVGLNPFFQRLVAVCGLDSLFDIRESLGAAHNPADDGVQRLTLVAQPLTS